MGWQGGVRDGGRETERERVECKGPVLNQGDSNPDLINDGILSTGSGPFYLYHISRGTGCTCPIEEDQYSSHLRGYFVKPLLVQINLFQFVLLHPR